MLMCVVMMMAAVVVRLCIVSVRAPDMSRRRGHGVVYAGSCPPFDQIKGVIEYPIRRQSFEIFFHRLGAPWKSDH